jgi:hypothetical protein
MYICIGEDKREGRLILLDSYTKHITSIMTSERLRYMPLNYGVHDKDSDGVIVVGAYDAAHATPVHIESVEYVEIYYKSSGNIRNTTMDEYIEELRYLNMLYTLDDFYEDYRELVSSERFKLFGIVNKCNTENIRSSKIDDIAKRLTNGIRTLGYNVLTNDGLGYYYYIDVQDCLRVRPLEPDKYSRCQLDFDPILMVYPAYAAEFVLNSQVPTKLDYKTMIDYKGSLRFLYLPEYITGVTDVPQDAKVKMFIRDKIFSV